MRSVWVLLLSVGVAEAAAEVRVRFFPERPGDGKPFLVQVEGLSESARIQGKFLDQDLVFRRDSATQSHLALAAVPLRTPPRRYTVRIRARLKRSRRDLSTAIETSRIAYPLSEVRIRPQKGAVKKGERAVDGRERIREALSRKTRERYWSLPFQRPLQTRVTEEFGVRRLYMRMKGHKIVRRWRGRHMGWDLDGDGGEPIAAVAEGVVATTGHFFGTGKCVFLDHGEQFFTAYFHMSDVVVKDGERVRRGQILGKVGATGRVSGPHLHLAARVNGVQVDPAALMSLNPPPP